MVVSRNGLRQDDDTASLTGEAGSMLGTPLRPSPSTAAATQVGSA